MCSSSWSSLYAKIRAIKIRAQGFGIHHGKIDNSHMYFMHGTYNTYIPSQTMGDITLWLSLARNQYLSKFT